MADVSLYKINATIEAELQKRNTELKNLQKQKDIVL